MESWRLETETTAQIQMMEWASVSSTIQILLRLTPVKKKKGYVLLLLCVLLPTTIAAVY